MAGNRLRSFAKISDKGGVKRVGHSYAVRFFRKAPTKSDCSRRDATPPVPQVLKKSRWDCWMTPPVP